VGVRGPIAIVEIVAEEVFVVLVVPGVALLFLGLVFLLFLLGLDGLQLFRGNFLEHRVLDHFLIQELRQLERRHRQQLDRLLQ
jgi:hypothetical protein